MQKEVRDILRIRFKLVVLEYAQEIGSATKAFREFEVPRSIQQLDSYPRCKYATNLIEKR